MMIERRGDWMSGKLADAMVMMSVDHGTYISLASVGTRIWELIESPRRLEDICAALCDEFDVDADLCRAEVLTFLKDLERKGAVSLVADAPA